MRGLEPVKAYVRDQRVVASCLIDTFAAAIKVGEAQHSRLDGVPPNGIDDPLTR